MSKQLKLEQVLSLKTAQEIPSLREFMDKFVHTIREINESEGKLLFLEKSAKGPGFGSEDVSTVLKTYKDALSYEINRCSLTLENILDETIRRQDETIGLSFSA